MGFSYDSTEFVTSTGKGVRVGFCHTGNTNRDKNRISLFSAAKMLNIIRKSLTKRVYITICKGLRVV